MLKNVLTESMYILCGIICFYSAFVAVKDKNHPSKWPTAIFWGILGVIFSFSNLGVFWGSDKPFMNETVIGYLIVALAVLSATKLVKVNKFSESTSEFKEKAASRIGNRIFIPALALGVVAFIVAQIWTKQLGSMVALGIASAVAAIFALLITKGKPVEMAEDTRRLMEIVGPVSILPQLLAALGSVFTAAGVGAVISGGIKDFIPQGNILMGVIAYCVGMALFTMIMGNGFAAFAVITAGVGVPFVFAQGANPAIAAALALTAGYCGTLLTPMAANFNIVPTAILDIKDRKYGIIRYQAPIALVLLIIHITLMYMWAF